MEILAKEQRRTEWCEFVMQMEMDFMDPLDYATVRW